MSPPTSGLEVCRVAEHPKSMDPGVMGCLSSENVWFPRFSTDIWRCVPMFSQVFPSFPMFSHPSMPKIDINHHQVENLAQVLQPFTEHVTVAVFFWAALRSTRNGHQSIKSVGDFMDFYGFLEVELNIQTLWHCTFGYASKPWYHRYPKIAG